MRDFYKQHAVMICGLICLLLIMGAWLGVRLSADAGTYRLDDIWGDRALLNGATIEMKLSDTVHTQSMTLTNGALSHAYKSELPLSQWQGYSHYASQTFVEHADADVKMDKETRLEHSDSEIELWVNHVSRAADMARVSVSLENYESDGSIGWAQVVTDVIVRDKNYPFVFNLEGEKNIYKNQISADGAHLPDEVTEWPYYYTQTDVRSDEYTAENEYNAVPYTQAPDGTTYFTPALRPYHEGTSAIYRVDEWGSYGYSEEPKTLDGYACYSMDKARSVGDITKLASFPVDGHEMRTVALDVVQNKLCLLIVVDNMLTLRVYSMDGILESEAPLFEMSPQYHLATTLNANQSDGSLMLCYHLMDTIAYDAENIEPKATVRLDKDILFCVELNEDATLRSVTEGHEAILRSAFIGGRWILVEITADKNALLGYYLPRRYVISVLNAFGEELYKGELVTDAQEDVIQYYLYENDMGYVYGDYSVSRQLQCENILEEKPNA